MYDALNLNTNLYLDIKDKNPNKNPVVVAAKMIKDEPTLIQFLNDYQQCLLEENKFMDEADAMEEAITKFEAAVKYNTFGGKRSTFTHIR